MARAATRVRVDEVGGLTVIDPGFDCIDLIRSVDPAFEVRSAPLPGFEGPRFLRVREAGCGLSGGELRGQSLESLWSHHAHGMNLLRSSLSNSPRTGEASLLDLKVELTFRILSRCRLCARRCEVDRTRGELGVCGLELEATVAEHFVHIAEEAPINPSLVLSLAGCGLRCRFCQQGALLDPAIEGDPLDPALWKHVDTHSARSLSFIGGNPDESLYAILRFLCAAPVDWHLPIVWNSHAYTPPEIVELLDGVVDAYIPDLKYGSTQCGKRLSGVPAYPDTAIQAIDTMIRQDVPVIVRILVLPGHVDCCHLPALDRLSAIANHGLLVSVRPQYSPDWKITQEDGALARHAHPEEVRAVWTRCQTLNLSTVT